MFAKPYKLKSNTSLKNTEKKQLTQRVLDEFPLATEEKVKEIVPPKENCSCMKLVLHTGDVVSVYSVEGTPMLIETPDGLVPTVCALWKVPDLVPSLTIHSPVLGKVQNGAPLYLPGVVLPAAGAGFPLFRCGTLLGVHTEDNAAAAVVGRAAMSSADMLLRASGVCLDTLHVYGDALCTGPKVNKLQRPKVAPTKAAGLPINLSTNLKQISLQPTQEEWPSLGPRAPPSVPRAPPAAPSPEPRVACEPPVRRVNEPALIPDTDNVDGENNESLSEPCEGDAVPTDMDGLLRWCLLCFIKLEHRSVTLPLNTNLLYKNHMQPLCPPDMTLDVKKSSYKKLSKFLEAMQEEGLLETREIERGVSACVALRPAHRAVRAARPLARPAAPAPAPHYTPPRVREVLCVTAAVLPLFAPLKKGTPLSSSEVRARLTEYVRVRSLAAAAGTVALDALLAKVLGKAEQEVVKWDVLMSVVSGRMTAGTELSFGDAPPALAKSRLEPVKMKVDLRSGNKKVTLVSNLEQFGFSPAELASECQRGIAASCGVTRSPAVKGDQLMLQGDQTHFMAKLLIEKYQLPKKFVENADKALNKKK